MTYEEFWDVIHPSRKIPNPIPVPTSVCEVDGEGVKMWRLNGLLHREGGPAIERPDGTREWCLNGVFQRREDPP